MSSQSSPTESARAQLSELLRRQAALKAKSALAPEEQRALGSCASSIGLLRHMLRISP